MADDKTVLRTLLDRAAIRRCVSLYASAVDRHDEARIGAVFHPDAIDDHGRYVGGVGGFVKWVNHVHETNEVGHSHNVTTHRCDLDGEVAHAESYILWVLRHRRNDMVLFGSGRYLDRLECRNGQWRIVLRRVVREMRFECPSMPAGIPPGFPGGRWDDKDPVYNHLPNSIATPDVCHAGDGAAMSRQDAAILRRLSDRQSIGDCIALAARASDRADRRLAGLAAAGEVAESLVSEHPIQQDPPRWTHNLTTHIGSIEGRNASARTRILHVRQDEVDMLTLSSLIFEDQLIKTAEGWRIHARQTRTLWQRRVRAIPLNPEDGPQLSRRDAGDLSYQRPLQAPV